jgi:Family of unknown function (DUF6599)
MRRTQRLAVALVVVLLALACVPLTFAAKRIETYPSNPATPPAETAKPEGAKPAAEEPRPAAILRAAAEKAGLPISGTIASETAEALAPPAEAPTEPEASPGPETETPSAAPSGGEPVKREDTAAKAEPSEPAVEPAKPSPLAVPEWITGQPYADYRLIALAGATLTHPKGQSLRAALYEFETPEEAWGFWSNSRGEKSLPIGQATSYGPELRLWQGDFAAVLTLDPPDPRMDEVRLSAFGRILAALIPGRGKPPAMAGWLPSTNQLPYTLVYFHTRGPLGKDAMNLSADTEGVSAQYEVGETVRAQMEQRYGPATPEGGYVVGGTPPLGPVVRRAAIERGVVVRYPSAEEALRAWDVFVARYVGRDPTSGTRGTRRVAPVGGGWNGVQLRGSVAAFVLGAPARNQADILLIQGLARAQ